MIFCISGISDIFCFFFRFFVVSGGSGRYLESLLEALCFILTEYEPVSSHGESIRVDFGLQGGNSVTPNIQKTKKYVFGYLLYPMKEDKRPMSGIMMSMEAGGTCDPSWILGYF